MYVMPEFGGRPIGSISSTDCEAFLAALVARGMSPATLKHHWSVLRNVFVYAHRKYAVVSNPVDAVDYSGNSAARRNKRHHPLAAEEVAAVAASIGERYPVYELFTFFAASTGLRAEELAGCEVRDLVFKPGVDGVNAEIHVCRAKKRRAGEWDEERDGCRKRQPGTWVEDKLKSAKSARTIPLPPWLAVRMFDYLETKHVRADEPTAPLWPNRALGGSRRRGCRAIAALDYSEPVDPGGCYKNLFRPALEDVGLPASRPATADAPAIQGVRMHDLRHTFAVLQLSDGKPILQVSQWLGHSTYTLTLDVYGGWMPKDAEAAANSLPEPVAPAKIVATPSNVVSLFG